MEEGDVVSSEAEVLDGRAQLSGVGEKVGEDDDEGALGNRLGRLVERVDERCRASGLDLADRVEDRPEVGGAPPRREIGRRRFLFPSASGDPEADGVALVGREIGQ